MKLIKKFTRALLCLTLLVITSCNGDKVPPAAQAFIQQNFPGQTIVYVDIDDDEDGREYTVLLSDGMKIEFDYAGNWKQMSSIKSGIPAALIPAPIAQYVKENHPSAAIFELTKEFYGYKIELSNDLELKFDEQGQFLTIDD